MDRGLTLVVALQVLALLLLTTCILPTQGYFDPALATRNYPCSIAEARQPPAPLDPFFEPWFARPLQEVGEPSLYATKPPAGTTSIRFTYLPAFVEPIIVRIDDLYGPSPRLKAYRAIGPVTLTPWTFVDRRLTPGEIAPIREMIASSGVLDLSPDTCISGIDGHIFLIEANGPGGYRFINRWGVHEGPVYELGASMFRLTGWPNTAQGPDYSRPMGPWPPEPPVGWRTP